MDDGRGGRRFNAMSTVVETTPTQREQPATLPPKTRTGSRINFTTMKGDFLWGLKRAIRLT